MKFGMLTLCVAPVLQNIPDPNICQQTQHGDIE